MAQNTRQYVITDTKGRILVSHAMATAFVKSQGDYNRFLAQLGTVDAQGNGYSQSDLPQNINKTSTSSPEQQKAALQKIHEAWDKYMVSVGLGYGDNADHDFYVGWETFSGDNTPLGGYPVWQMKQAYTFERLWRDNQTGVHVAATPEQIKADKEAAFKSTFGDEAFADFIEDYPNFTAENLVAAAASGSYTPLKDTDGVTPKSFDKELRYSLLYKNAEGALGLKDADYNIDVFARVPITQVERDGEMVDILSAAELQDIVPAQYDASGAITNEDTATKKFVKNEFGGWYWAGDYYTQEEARPKPINYDGTTQAQRDLYDYAIALTAAYHSDAMITAIGNGDIQTAANPENTSVMQYYRNIFNEMAANGFYTYGNRPADTNDYDVQDDVYLPYPMADGAAIPNAPGGSTPRNTSPLADNNTFERYIREGAIQIKYYSATERKFINTTISEDQGVQEVKDERQIAMAEVTYQQRMRDLERKDKMLDMELKKIDTEHNALQTEYDSIKGIISKNIEKTFSMFS